MSANGAASVADRKHDHNELTLAQQKPVPLFVHQMLVIAHAGGMPKVRAEELYYEIMDCYAKLDGGVIEFFRDDFNKILAVRE